MLKKCLKFSLWLLTKWEYKWHNVPHAILSLATELFDKCMFFFDKHLVELIIIHRSQRMPRCGD